MASPRDPPSQSQAQPLTPPADPPNPNPTPALNPSTNQITTCAPTAASPPPPPTHPLTSHTDPGTARRPRDARLIHLILSSLGVLSYQERVPLQLLDYAYRYTSSVLGDAAFIQMEGYVDSVGGAEGAGKGRGGGKMGAAGPASEREEVSLASLRMAIGSRLQYQYQAGGLGKEFLMGLARERNRVGLGVGRGLNGHHHAQDANGNATAAMAGQMIGGVRLPPEKYCLTGVGWGMREEWDSEGEEELPFQGGEAFGGENGDEAMALGMGMGMEEGNGDEDAEATMEDIFGDGGGGGDADMQDG